MQMINGKYEASIRNNIYESAIDPPVVRNPEFVYSKQHKMCDDLAGMCLYQTYKDNIRIYYNDSKIFSYSEYVSYNCKGTYGMMTEHRIYRIEDNKYINLNMKYDSIYVGSIDHIR